MHIGVRNIIEFKALCTLKFKRIFLSLDKLLSKNWICTYHKFTLRRHLSKCTKLKTTLWHYLPSRLYQFQSDLIPMNVKLCLKVPEWGIKTSWWQKQGWLLEKNFKGRCLLGYQCIKDVSFCLFTIFPVKSKPGLKNCSHNLLKVCFLTVT